MRGPDKSLCTRQPPQNKDAWYKVRPPTPSCQKVDKLVLAQPGADKGATERQAYFLHDNKLVGDESHCSHTQGSEVDAALRQREHGLIAHPKARIGLGQARYTAPTRMQESDTN